ncbi:MAG: hypothetical protein BLM47_00035 [Candidatus Reconcilbacillus cellulovorans]|uniref:Uncharacterized protein n=1 Tax=Candidatus Reconcilbacillus cellulovorans TaxID=1906605 RepID=A0A2A6E3J9_9BACL|nr:MAG: hypothetical protein BLM47_00035 [Candidatus Reconcilbacillus cellulovorans]
MHRTYKALQELQQKAAEKVEVQQAQQTANEAKQTANEAKATADAVQYDLSAHASSTTGVHGATPDATANAIVQRDSSGRAKVAAPEEPDDIARLDTVDDVVVSAFSAHIGAADPHTQYLLKTAYTAADVLAKIKTVDGAGSGLDADMVDGLDSSAFTRKRVFTDGTYDFSNRGVGSFVEEIKNNGGITIQNGPPGATGGALIQTEGSNYRWIQQIFLDQNGKIWFRRSYDNGSTRVWESWQQVWTSNSQPQLRINNGRLEFWDGSQWKQAGMGAASGTGTTDGSAVLTVGGLSFQPAYIIVSQEIYNGGGYNQYLRVYSVGGEWFNNYRMRNITNGGPDDVIETSGFTITANGFSCAMVEAYQSAKWYAFGSIA